MVMLTSQAMVMLPKTGRLDLNGFSIDNVDLARKFEYKSIKVRSAYQIQLI